MAKTSRLRTRLWKIWEITSLVLVLVILAMSIRATQEEKKLQEQPITGNPLAPLDLTSPRALLLSFFSTADEVAAAYNAFESSPSLLTQRLLHFEITRLKGTLDTSGLPPAEQEYLGTESSFMLWDILSRIKLPPMDEIPDETQLVTTTTEDEKGEPLESWTIPDTDITLVKIKKGANAGKWLFSSRTVLKLDDYYRLTQYLPYVREIAINHPPRQVIEVVGGWMFPPQTVLNLPPWLQLSVLDQPVWKWLAMGLLYALMFLILAGVFTWAWHPSRTSPLWHFFRRLSTPAAMLAMLPTLYFFQRFQIVARGDVGQFIAYTMPTVAFYVALAWGGWLIANILGELIISTPRINSNSTDAHLIRLGFRVSGLILVVVVVFQLGTYLGIPLYGLIAGAGVGTLAIALAAQSTLENFIGSLNLYADRPVSTGDFCVFGNERGTIEEIGLRSTRIRGIDRTVHTIPNAEFSKMGLINYTKRDRMLFRHFLRLRLDTPPDQLRFVLAKLRELIVAHPRLLAEPSRARLRKVTDDALEVELFAYVDTNLWPDFLAVQEDLLIHVLEVIDESGSSLALPASTTYLARAVGSDEAKAQATSATVAQWREESRLPFPDLSPEARAKLENTLAYPPEGSLNTGKVQDKGANATETPSSDSEAAGR